MADTAVFVEGIIIEYLLVETAVVHDVIHDQVHKLHLLTAQSFECIKSNSMKIRTPPLLLREAPLSSLNKKD